MSFKTLVICASALFVQSVMGQYIPTASAVSGNSIVTNNLGNIGLSLATDGLAALGTGRVAETGTNLISGIPGYNIVSSGPLIVTSISPIGPSGLAVASENVIEGILSVTGQLPYLSAVSFEGSLPTIGSGVATCGCGNGNVGIINEALNAAPVPNLNRGRNFV